MTNNIGINKYNQLEDVVNESIGLNGIAVVIAKNDHVVWVHTVGNTEKGLPELIMFCNEYNINDSMYLLEQLSIFMYNEEVFPKHNRPLVFKGKHFHPILIDRFFIHRFAAIAMSYYNHSPVISFVLLLTPDYNGIYPNNPEYSMFSTVQQHLKLH